MRATSSRAVIALGSNLGDRRVHLEVGLARLAREPGVSVQACSSWHETAPVGGPPGQSPYLNGVAQIETELSPRELLAKLQEIEARAGRDRAHEARNGPRTLDLDLLFHGEQHLREPGLEVPHPRLEEREFVLAPLSELEPERLLEKSGRTVRDQLRHLRGNGALPARNARNPSAPEIVRFDDPRSAQQWCRERRARGETLGFVPTMGALHAGHLELARRAAEENDVAVVSVFVNPLQFNDPQDFARYPRDFDGDAAMLAREGVAMVFTGTLEQFFPGQVQPGGNLANEAWLEPGPSAAGLEGSKRPGHFRGVATIVKRLFESIEPTRAYFGQKDFQQSLVVSDLARARGGPEIVICPTSREPSGLARSSRNQLLTPAERARAAGLFAALSDARDAWLGGERRADALSERLRAALSPLELEVEYAEVRDPRQWSANAPRGRLECAIALLAVRVGRTRLIDNLRLDEPASGVR